jgi:hypothetical protein
MGLLLLGPMRDAGVSETQDGFEPAVALAVAGRGGELAVRPGASKGSIHSTGHDTTTREGGNEIIHCGSSFRGRVGDDGLIIAPRMIRKQNLRQAAAVS